MFRNVLPVVQIDGRIIIKERPTLNLSTTVCRVFVHDRPTFRGLWLLDQWHFLYLISTQYNYQLCFRKILAKSTVNKLKQTELIPVLI